MSQVLFTEITPPNSLGINLYSLEKEGEALDRMVHCVEHSSFKKSLQDCGETARLSTSSETQDFLVRTDTALRYVYFDRLVPVVVGNDSQHEIVGVVGAQYRYERV
jgi:hypothetical protein